MDDQGETGNLLGVTGIAGHSQTEAPTLGRLIAVAGSTGQHLSQEPSGHGARSS